MIQCGPAYRPTITYPPSNAMNDEIPKPENSLARSIVWTVCTTFTHLIAAVVLLVVMVRVVPWYIMVFEAYDAELPVMTQHALNLHLFTVDYWYLLFPLGLLLDAAILFVLSRLPTGTRWLGTVWFGAVLLATILSWALIDIAVNMPAIRLIEELAK